ncbi:uncharacterized protein B0H18DRAFT_389678 [Fomitopsis serialis]|uniref:uncharacterized protein n=1 Tax=Fomitopsis serialis TaxID=139415 RepID=UPI0020072DE1|nr:uncharacterized protein B0H18DRAFT_389678 [Neoantrodia serialis]KAH9925174.1 hypothetical protein B0H18DRAFT_389678 [Neoantrodia serialis]
MSRANSTHDNAAAGAEEPGIMTEVIRAMSSELRRARTEQDRLHAENERLQQELDGACLTLRALREGEDEKSPTVDHTRYSKLYEEARQEIDRLTQERDGERSHHEVAMEEIQGKPQELSRIRNATANAFAELSEVRAPSSRKRKERTEDDHTPIITQEAKAKRRQTLESQPDLPASEAGPAVHTQALTIQDTHANLSKDTLDVRSFLDVNQGEILKEPSLRHCQWLSGHEKWTDFKAKLASARLDLQTIYCPPESIIWSPRSTMRCLFIHPLHCYVSETRSYRPFDYKAFLGSGQTRDVCLLQKLEDGDATGCYCGTFRCVGASNLSFHDVCQLGLSGQVTTSVISELYLADIISRTFCSLIWFAQLSCWEPSSRPKAVHPNHKSSDNCSVMEACFYAATSWNS